MANLQTKFTSYKSDGSVLETREYFWGSLEEGQVLSIVDGMANNKDIVRVTMDIAVGNQEGAEPNQAEAPERTNTIAVTPPQEGDQGASAKGA